MRFALGWANPTLGDEPFDASIFVDKQTSKGIAKPTVELFDSLININLNISEGLLESQK